MISELRKSTYSEMTVREPVLESVNGRIELQIHAVGNVPFLLVQSFLLRLREVLHSYLGTIAHRSSDLFGTSYIYVVCI